MARCISETPSGKCFAELQIQLSSHFTAAIIQHHSRSFAQVGSAQSTTVTQNIGPFTILPQPHNVRSIQGSSRYSPGLSTRWHPVHKQVRSVLVPCESYNKILISSTDVQSVSHAGAVRSPIHLLTTRICSGFARIFEDLSGSECINMEVRRGMTPADISQVGVGFVVMGALGYVVKLSTC